MTEMFRRRKAGAQAPFPVRIQSEDPNRQYDRCYAVAITVEMLFGRRALSEAALPPLTLSAPMWQRAYPGNRYLLYLP